uniref:Lipoprotein n=1 Tax=Panagrellus redivivus TaxID=6233 RepID=A0A7E4VB19_PANRE
MPSRLRSAPNNRLAKIAEVTPTGLPDIPSNLSPEAQQVANEIKAVVLNLDNTVSQDRDAIKAIVEKASPAVQAELKALKREYGC